MENKKEKPKQEKMTKEPEAEKKTEAAVAEKPNEAAKANEIKKTSGTKKEKKTEAIVRGIDIPISTKTSYAICKFIKHKEIEKAIRDLGEIILHKQALPMKGEIPHRKGKIMSGRYPETASGHFIKLLQSLNSNATVNGIENPVITEAIAGFSSRPYGRFGRTRKKRTFIKITAKSKITEKQTPKRGRLEEKKK